MNQEQIKEEAGNLTENVKRAGENIADYSADAYKAASERTTDALACATEAIRNNPVPAVVGALALGITIGCLIMTGRNPSVIDEDTFADAGHAVSKSLSRLADNLKFW